MKEKITELKPIIFEVYSDGACSPNPGRGGYGYVLRYVSPADALTEINVQGSGGYVSTTNNRMELMGCLQGLRKATELFIELRNSATPDGVDPEAEPVKLPFKAIHVLSDSSYLCRGFDKGWVKKWQLNGWKTVTGDQVKNADLWQEINSTLTSLRIWFGMGNHFICVPGHRGHKFNEICDSLAVAARKSINCQDDDSCF